MKDLVENIKYRGVFFGQGENTKLNPAIIKKREGPKTINIKQGNTQLPESLDNQGIPVIFLTNTSFCYTAYDLHKVPVIVRMAIR